MDTALLLALASLAGADLAMTSACVAQGLCREMNPLLRPLSLHPAAFGAVKAGITAGAVIGIWKATTHKPRARIVALISIVAMQAVVVSVNYSRLH